MQARIRETEGKCREILGEGTEVKHKVRFLPESEIEVCRDADTMGEPLGYDEI